MKIAIIAIACLYTAINLVVSRTMSAKEMRKKYVDGQCTIGKIATNIFYLPAWLLKVVKIIIIYLVK